MPDRAERSDSVCAKCGAPLGKDDAGATRKFIDRDAEEFFCMRCLCSGLGCTESFLRSRIEFLRENGCLLFPKDE
ncbi:MAG: hypothetical protein K6G89_01160 [Clostridia bacterium]|nr:hypothetical protein [Clostridia bacterium]